MCLQQTRLIDLENEKARLEAMLRRDETAAQSQARQKAEIAARKEWLRVSNYHIHPTDYDEVSGQNWRAWEGTDRHGLCAAA